MFNNNLNTTGKNTYNFECTCCGDCCRGRQAVVLNRDDLVLLAKFHQFTNTAELFNHGIAHVLRSENGFWRPYIRFRTLPIRMCPFLRNEVSATDKLSGFCNLHPDSKPLVCHLAPLGRIIDLANNSQVWQTYSPSPGCPGMNKGRSRKIDSDLAPLQDRLHAEIDFFHFIEKHSSNCATAAEASKTLFSFELPHANF